MEIVWLGHSCFRVRGREATVVMDPCPPKSGYAIGKPTADIVTISHPHENHNFLKAVAGSPTVLDGAGEYEIHGAFLTAIATYHDGERGAERGKNLAWVVEMEEIKIVHLGDLGHTPSAEQVEDMVGCDVLFVPVGGSTTIDGAKAAEVVAMLEAKIVVPMHYQTEVHKDSLDTPERFFKEMEVKAIEPQPKLQITQSNIPPDTQVVLLDYKGRA
jgi:L-ascorbate metabolism protein UlaG (beta-lactamase superfamily)